MDLNEEDIDQQETLDQILIQAFQQRIPYARGDLRELAYDIRELIGSHACVRRYIQRLDDRGNQTRSTSVDVATTLSTDGKTRIRRKVRARKPWPGNPGAGRNATVLNDPTQGVTGNATNSSTRIHQTPQPAITKSSASLEAKSKHAPEYHCVLCDKSFASKGNCRKHLEDQHVSRKFQQCEGCSDIFPSVPAVFSHCKSCPRDASRSRITPYREVKMDRRVYGSEFSGECFTTKREYVDHLLERSKRTKAMKHPSQLLWKFQALLSQPALDVELKSVLQNHFGLSVMLQDLKWDEEYMAGVIPTLEQGVVEIEPGPPQALRRQTVRPFLESLISMSRHTNYAGIMQHNSASIPECEVEPAESYINAQEGCWQSVQEAHRPWPLLQTHGILPPHLEDNSSSLGSVFPSGSNSFFPGLDRVTRSPNDDAAINYSHCNLREQTEGTACSVNPEPGSQPLPEPPSFNQSLTHLEAAAEQTQVENNSHMFAEPSTFALAPESAEIPSQAKIWLPGNGDLPLQSGEPSVTFPYEFDCNLYFTHGPT